MQEAVASPAAADSPPPLDVDSALAAFEARCDKTDPDQVALLEAMREHTRRLHQTRGDWNVANTRRNCNSAAPRESATAPQAIESFRAYKQHVAKETQWQQLQQQRNARPLALTQSSAQLGQHPVAERA